MILFEMILLHNVRRKGFLFFLLLVHSGLIAQRTTHPLSALIDSAKVHIPALLQKQALIDAAKANIIDVRHSFLPKLNAGDEISVGSANDVAGSFLPVAGIIHPISGSITGESNLSAQTNNLASLYAEYELVNFGLRGARVNNAVAYADLQQADFDKDLYIAQLQISKLYFDVLKNTYLLNIDEQNIKRYQSIDTIIQALTISGIKAGVDSSLAKAEISKIKVSYNQRFGAITQLKQQLHFLTGIPVTNIDVDTLQSKELLQVLRNQTATESPNNPLFGYYYKQRSFYQSSENLVRKSYLPKVSIIAGGWARGSSVQYNENYKPLYIGLGMQRLNYLGGIAITYDLFNGIHTRDKLAVNRYQTKAADYNLEQQKLALENSTAQAQTAIETAEKNLIEYPIQIKAASDAYEQKKAQYGAGIINLIDLLNASFVLYTAQVGYVETVNDWLNAHLDKAASTGTLNQFIQTVQQQ